MNIINTPQGSQDWLQIRKLHRTASEAPAAFGVSKFTSRTELLKQKQSGLTEEVNDATQALYDRGHAAEAAARPFANAIVGDDLYPITGTLTVDGIDLLASLDGATMDESIIWEHKLFSEKLAADVRNGTLDPHYTIQLDQQLLVSGAKKCLFMTSDGTEENMAWCWYESTQTKFDAVVSVWKQFEVDLANYEPTVIKEMPIAEAIAGLPDLFIHAKGEITTSNMAEYGVALALQLKAMRAIVLSTDQDFANAKASAKHLRASIVQAKAAKEAMLASTVTVGEAAKMIDTWCEDMRVTALQMEQDVEREDGVKKTAMVQKARLEFTEHVAALNTRIGKPYMPVTNPDFAAVMKGKRSYTNMQDAVDTEMARVKIEANATADKIQTNLNTLTELASDCKHLFVDTAQIVLKAPDDLTALVKTRIAEYKEAEAKRLEAEREKMRVELLQEAADAETARVAKVAADKLEADRLEAQAIADATPNTPIVEAKPEPVVTVVLDTVNVAPTMRATVGYVTPAKLAAAIPVQTSTTRAEINTILDTLNEANLVRVLHFVKIRFASANLDPAGLLAA